MFPACLPLPVHPYSLGLRTLPAIMIGILVILTPRVGGAKVSLDQAQHLIITPASLVSSFERLAIHRTVVADLPSCVIALEDVLAAGPAGRDDAETLRNYVIQLHQMGNLKYVLLGGDFAVMPVRYARSVWYPTTGFSDIESDLYFACLDGDWDADGDNIFGEAYRSFEDQGDDVDQDPELAVGRAPVSGSVQAQRFVDGLIQYDLTNPASYLSSAALLAEVLFPVDWGGGPPNLDGATYAEEAARILSLHPQPPMATRLYEYAAEYPAAALLTVPSAWEALNMGAHGLLYVIGNGTVDNFSVGNGYLTKSDVDILENAPAYYLVLALSSESASFQDDSILEHLVLAPEGGAAAALGFSDVAFATTAEEYYVALLNELVSGPGILIGDGMRTVLSAMAPGFGAENFQRWTSFTWCLLGDPGMPFRTELNPVPVEKTTTGSFKSRFRKR